MRYIAGFPLEKVKMSDICFLPLHTSTIKVYVIFLNGSCQEDTAKTSWNPFYGDDTSIYIHFQDLMAASGSQHWWYWLCQQGKSLLLGLTTAVSSLDQLCNVICIALEKEPPDLFIQLYQKVYRRSNVPSISQNWFQLFVTVNLVCTIGSADILVPILFYLSLFAPCKPSSHYSFMILSP